MITKELIKKDNDNGIFNLKFAIKNTIESIEDTLLDLANYAVMTLVELENSK